jgi:DNA polymerase-1
MKILFNGELDPTWPSDVVAGVYNALDCAVTLEIAEELKPQLSKSNVSDDVRTYRFMKTMQAPALEMMLRGVRVDHLERLNQKERMGTILSDLNTWLQQLGEALSLPFHKEWTKPHPKTKAPRWSPYINPNSPKGLKELFYQHLGYKEITVFDKSKRESRVTTDRDALEKIRAKHPFSAPIVNAILAVRDTKREMDYLSEQSEDGRFRFSINIAATETARWSTSKSAWGTGYNAQNIKPELRLIFIADKGYKICNIDLEQAESRFVALEAPGLAYWEACHSGDLHTSTCRWTWPSLPWAGDASDRVLADKVFYRHFSRRDFSKRIGHGSNYFGSARGIAQILHIPTEPVQQFQDTYFKVFPEIPLWHLEVKRKLQLDGYLVTPFGRKRWFHGRRDDDATLREAIASNPQSSIADYLNRGLVATWYHLSKHGVQILLQGHDAITFQYPEGHDYLIAEVQKLLALEINHVDSAGNAKRLVVPSEAKVGWNWGSASPTNPDGLVKWKGSDARTRTGVLDKVFR